MAASAKGSRISTPVWVVLLVAAALAGAAASYYLLPREAVSYGDLGGKTSLSEGELDRAVGTYTVGGEAFEVTARDAILQASSLEAALNEDGTYVMPSTENVVSAARTAIVQAEVQRRGITVSDEDLDAYTEENFGTTDYASIAANYTMDEETVRKHLQESAAMAKLREEVVSTKVSDLPGEPAAPEDGNQDAASADYATYIIELAGDEWDGETGAWVSDEGPYAAALKDFDVRPDYATYAAAQTAYYVAYQLHSASTASASAEWSSYVNGLLCDANFAVCSLVS